MKTITTDYILIIVLTIVSIILLPLNINAQRLQTPDGEVAINTLVINANNTQIRLASTNYSLYISKYLSNLGWTKNNELYTTPAGRRIVDFAFKFNETGNKRTLIILHDNGQISILSLNINNLMVEGKPSLISGPAVLAGGQNTFRKIIIPGNLYILFGTRVYVNRNDGLGWTRDSLGLGGATINDIVFDNQKTIYAATSRGLFSQGESDSSWRRMSGFDSTVSCNSIFIQRSNKWWVGTSNRGPFYSTNSGLTWVRDTTGFGNTSVFKFGDDAFGNVYGLTTVQSNYLLYRKLSNGTKWERIDTNLRNFMKSTPRLYSALGDSTLEVGTSYGNYFSKDFGSSWESSNDGFMSDDIYGLQFLPDGKIVTSTALGIFFKDGITSPWKKTYPSVGFASGRVLRRDKFDNLYTLDINSLRGRQPYPLKSTNFGLTWEMDTLGISNVPSAGGFFPSVYYVDENQGQHFGLSSIPSNSVRIYSRTPNNPFAMDTLGTNLKPMTGNTFDIFATFGSDGNTLYFSDFFYTGGTYSNANVFSRNFNDNIWSLDTAGMGNGYIISMIADKNKNMIAGGLNPGTISSVYIKYGAVWEKINLPPASTSDARFLGVDSNNVLYIAFGPFFTNTNAYRGVFATSDKGNSWSYCGLDSITTRGLQALDNEMYCFTNRGVFKLNATFLKSPKLVLGVKSLDFGKVSQNNFKELTLKIENKGNDTLRISNITSTNAVFAAQNRQFNIAPNEFINVPIRFTPTANQIFKGTMRIISNDFPDSVLVTGEGVDFKFPKMLLSHNIIDFGTVQGDSFKDTIVVITNTGDDTLKITNIRSNSNSFIPQPTTAEILPGKSIELAIRFAPKVNGDISSIIRISGNVPTDTIYVSGYGENVAVPKIQLSSTLVYFGVVDIGKSKDTTVIITNIGKDTLRISSMISTSGFFSITKYPSVLGISQSDTVFLRFSPAMTGQFMGTIRITSNANPDSINVVGRGNTAISVENDLFKDHINFSVFPNPSYDLINIKLNLLNQEFISIYLIDIFGNNYNLLLNGKIEEGEHSFQFYTRDFSISGGLYFVKLVSIGGKQFIKPFVLLK